MNVRPVTRYEAGLFASTGPDSKRTESVLVQLWDECRSCPEWCFLGLKDGRAIARIGFWVLPSIVTTFHIAWLHLPWDGDFAAAGLELWRGVLERVRGYGATGIESALDSDDDHLDERRRFYDRIGLSLIQEKAEYRRRTGATSSGSGTRLRFQTAAEAGERAFVQAIQRVTEGTLDREDLEDLRTEGPAEAGRRYLGILKDIDNAPERWQLAYAAPQTGASFPTLVGLIAPQRFSDDVGAINYIGVVPELRGRGYVDDLLARGVMVLAEAGVKHVIASIDVVNLPMIAAAERAGFRRKLDTDIYRLKLDSTA